MAQFTQNSGCTFQLCLKMFTTTPQINYLFDVYNLQRQFKFVLTDLTPEINDIYSTFEITTDLPVGNYKMDVYEENDIELTNKLTTEHLTIN